LVSPRSYTPRHLAEKILASRAAIEGERKHVTVLFADIKGSLELIDGRDPEQVQTVLDFAIREMMAAVHRYEGTVNRVQGDGIMALFGAPLAHEDHAVRACYAALAMQEALRGTAEEARRAQAAEVQVRVGLNSGDVVVRAIGNDLSMDYDAIGQTTHLAARMEQLAVPGTVRLTDATFRLAEAFVQGKSLGPTPIKGLKEPVEVFELTGATATRTRFQASVARGLTRFVGRQAEFEMLDRARTRAGEGHGQIVAVIGEAGVGKSRLFYEFIHSPWTGEWLILEGTSVSYGKATSYLPVIDLLKTYFRIEDRDDDHTIREKVADRLGVIDEGLEPMLVPFLALLDVHVEDTAWDALDPPQRRRRTMEGVKRLLLAESRAQPLVLVFEDLHWIDSETQAFLDGLVKSLPTARILLLVNYRPEYTHDWASRADYTQWRIDPLAPENAEELLATLLGDDPGLVPLKRMVVARAEGNPFFLEESVRTLVETGALDGAPGAYRVTQDIELIEMPATVQGILAERIDRLAVEDKQLLQTAAVIGKTVPYALLRAIADRPEEDLRRGLADLQEGEFLYGTRLFPDLEHTFKHSLTHEVAYGGLLQERRRGLHRRIAHAIESVYAARLAEQVERLAHHYTEAGLAEHAVGYWHQAGQRAIERSANLEAVGHLTKGLEVLEGLPDTAKRDQQEFGLLTALGAVQIATEGPGTAKVERSYARARELRSRFRDTPEHYDFVVLWGRWRLCMDLKLARRLADELLDVAQSQQDPNLLLQAHHAQWATLLNIGELTSCREHIEQGIALYDQSKQHSHSALYGGHDPAVCGRGIAAVTLWLLGYPDQALECADQGVSLARKLDHSASLAHALDFALAVDQYRRDPAAALERAEAMISFSTEEGFPHYLARGTMFRGWALAMREDDPSTGIEEMRKGLEKQVETGEEDDFPIFLQMMAEGYGLAGRNEEALREIDEALAIIHRRGVRHWWGAELNRWKGELLLARSVENRAEAEGCFEKAMDLARQQSARSLELRAAASLARSRPAGQRLRVVHRRPRHARSQGRQGPARRVDVTGRRMGRRRQELGTAKKAGAEATTAAGAYKAYRAGTHRTVAPADTLERVSPFMPDLGITRIANVTGLDRIGIPVVMVCRPNSRSIAVSQGARSPSRRARGWTSRPRRPPASWRRSRPTTPSTSRCRSSSAARPTWGPPTVWPTLPSFPRSWTAGSIPTFGCCGSRART
jgi:class 3 adenylate cyclase/predicted ATPase